MGVSVLGVESTTPPLTLSKEQKDWWRRGDCFNTDTNKLSTKWGSLSYTLETMDHQKRYKKGEVRRSMSHVYANGERYPDRAPMVIVKKLLSYDPMFFSSHPDKRVATDNTLKKTHQRREVGLISRVIIHDGERGAGRTHEADSEVKS